MKQILAFIPFLFYGLGCRQMQNVDFKITGVTLAVTDMDRMLIFYTHVFEIQFQKKEMFGTNLYGGQLGSLDLLLCPAAIARNEAKQNRHQLEIAVSNLDIFIEKINESGGELMGDIIMEPDGSRSVGIYDPDKNSILLKQYPQIKSN